MVLSIIFAHVWGVLELIALSTLTRTVRVRTVLASLAVGLYACSLTALLLQVSWTRVAAWLTGKPLFGIVSMASYTLDPFIEELVKVLPLVALILIIPAVRRQWSTADCVLIGAATGSGFGLAENLFRYSGAASRSIPVSGGWELAVNLAPPTVPSFTTTLTSWLPGGAQGEGLKFPDHYNLHLEWSALGGLAVALMFLHHGVRRRLGFALWLYVAADHAADNWTLSGGSGFMSVLAGPFEKLRGELWLMPAGALAIAWWLDRRRQRGARDPELAVTRERRSEPRVLGVLSSAMSRTPESILWVDTFTRLRRAYASALSNDTEGTGKLRRGLLSLRDRIDRLTAGSALAGTSSEHGTRRRLAAFIGQPKTVAWLVLMLPSALWLVFGGFPQTAWLQAALMTRPAWLVVRLLSCLGLVWLGWQLVLSARQWSQVASASLGDVPAAVALRLFSGTGALLFGTYTLFLAATGETPYSRVVNFHVLEAVAAVALIGALLTAVAALVFFPPVLAAIGTSVDAGLAELLGAEVESGLWSAGLGGESAVSVSTSIAEAQADAGVVSADATGGGAEIAGSIRYANPTGGSTNCVNCAIATDAILSGHVAAALPGEVTPISALEERFVTNFVSVTGPEEITSAMSTPGSRGIVYVLPTGEDVGHVFNVVNQDGVVRFLDGQTGTVFEWLGDFADIRLLKIR